MTKLYVKRIKEFPGYSAGNDGHIYSFWTIGRNAKIDYLKEPKKLAGGLNGSGYLHVVLVSNGNDKVRMIHRLIAETFYGKVRKNLMVSHKDGNKLNNTLENLCWETLSKNMQRKKLHGTDGRGCKNSRAKITNKQLITIRKLLTGQRLTHKQIGSIFDVSRVFITKIANNYRYTI